jgi:hypothetical protein
MPRALQMEENFSQDEFVWIVDNPRPWAWKSEELITAALVLSRHREETRTELLRTGIQSSLPDIFLAALVLWGFAIECLLKAVYVSAGNSLLEGKRLKSKAHDLEQLAGAASVTLSQDEVSVLRELSVILVSIGRYPTGLTAEKSPMGAGRCPVFYRNAPGRATSHPAPGARSDWFPAAPMTVSCRDLWQRSIVSRCGGIDSRQGKLRNAPQCSRG